MLFALQLPCKLLRNCAMHLFFNALFAILQNLRNHSLRILVPLKNNTRISRETANTTEDHGREKPELQRGLEARHIELIALGGTIGVGLFMGSASTLKWAGPSVLLAYIIAGLFVFFIMRSMGEMLFPEPVTGSFRRLCAPLHEPVLRLSDGPVILVYVDGGGYLGDYRDRGVCAVLVPGYGPVDTGADCCGAGGNGKPAVRLMVKSSSGLR